VKKDISNREDLLLLMHAFYEKVKVNESIGYFFVNNGRFDWEKHIGLMCDFWENTLFFTGNYEGNPLITHRKINKEYPTSAAHFKVWRKLFEQELKSLFAGPNVNKMIEHSRAIAKVMQEKI
jgi:hemoglobin